MRGSFRIPTLFLDVKSRWHPLAGGGGGRLLGRTSIKAVLSEHEGMGQNAYRNLACIMPGCTGENH